jgi:hypothetical protein
MGIYWYNKASDLRGAAGLVWAGMKDEQAAVARTLGLGKGFSFQVACWPVYLMLCGLALELLLKAAIVAQGREPSAHHRLAELWGEVGLAVTRKQRGLLEILTESIYWAGRYPVPQDEADFDRLSELRDKHLWDPAPTGTEGLVIRRRNSNLTWISFNELWSTAHASPALDALFDAKVVRARGRRSVVRSQSPRTP